MLIAAVELAQKKKEKPCLASHSLHVAQPLEAVAGLHCSSCDLGINRQACTVAEPAVEWTGGGRSGDRPLLALREAKTQTACCRFGSAAGVEKQGGDVAENRRWSSTVERGPSAVSKL